MSSMEIFRLVYAEVYLNENFNRKGSEEPGESVYTEAWPRQSDKAKQSMSIISFCTSNKKEKDNFCQKNRCTQQ